MPKRSSINDLPDSVREELDRELIQRGFGNYRELVDLLESKGVSISRSALHRYGSKLEQKVSRIEQSTQMAKAIAAASPDDAGAMNDALIRLVQSQLFDALLALDEMDADIDPQTLEKIAKSIGSIVHASVRQKDWQSKVQQRLDEAKGELIAASREGGVSEDTIHNAFERVLKGVL